MLLVRRRPGQMPVEPRHPPNGPCGKGRSVGTDPARADPRSGVGAGWPCGNTWSAHAPPRPWPSPSGMSPRRHEGGADRYPVPSTRGSGCSGGGATRCGATTTSWSPGSCRPDGRSSPWEVPSPGWSRPTPRTRCSHSSEPNGSPSEPSSSTTYRAPPPRSERRPIAGRRRCAGPHPTARRRLAGPWSGFLGATAAAALGGLVFAGGVVARQLPTGDASTSGAGNGRWWDLIGATRRAEYTTDPGLPDSARFPADAWVGFRPN